MMSEPYDSDILRITRLLSRDYASGGSLEDTVRHRNVAHFLGQYLSGDPGIKPGDEHKLLERYSAVLDE